MRTFLLGVGCQKGATTWIYKYLKASPVFVHGFRKECHVFDAIDVPEMAWLRTRTIDQVETAAASARSGEPVRIAHLLRAAMCADPQVYFDYFAGLLQRRGKSLAADVTPDYALLSAARLASIRGEFADRDVRTVPCFVMRDPVDRTVSAIRMRKLLRPEQVPQPIEDAVREMYRQPAFALRSDYRPTIAALDATFDVDEGFVGFYEELFDDRQVRRLCSLVGIDFHAPDYAFRPNAAESTAARLPDELTREIAEHHRGVYESVAARFDRDLTAVWPSARCL